MKEKDIIHQKYEKVKRKEKIGRDFSSFLFTDYNFF